MGETIQIMEKVIEQDIIQNIGIGALALHKYVQSYYSAKQKLRGTNLNIVMPVLPIVFHQKTLDSIYKRGFDGGMYNALSQFRDLPAGLQERMQNMSKQTFESLNLGFASRLITYDKCLNEILPLVDKVKIEHYNSDIKNIIKAADRLGYWFASMSFEQICIMLKINF
ncbi:MAG TPA: DUF6521 family protein [Ignavibacteriaceae bacterium]|nr:DUF6521 family protein [Ignavibacteriaceae bacterium]